MSKFLLAVSGGPDSMFLLNMYKNRNIVVCHVNYNKRESAKRDEEIVVSFCEQNNIKLYVKQMGKNYTYNSNFQNCARNIRYEFFKEIYDKENCDTLMTAHHLDDFLETCLMQYNAKKTPSYYGIKQETNIYGMKVIRPFLFKFRKKEIINLLDKKNIKYGIDETNELDIYERNKIRNNLKNISDEEFSKNVEKFLKLNENRIKKNDEILLELSAWKEQKYSCVYFANLVNKEEVLFTFLHKNYSNLKLSSSKLKSIIQFINSKISTSSFKLKDNTYLIKENDFIII
ncbi:tRNA lysidine(34) synthetase TilS [Mycoplasma elephantis]|uniref:tRNA lysidine(34) synthetase TilS n=1 Tax=Mycoplasma elephantis TaxID=114882 RepID=UPI0005629856|nr:tRNA lysidine(34) synthetase TilS [Mycoplasma elephantis]